MIVGIVDIVDIWIEYAGAEEDIPGVLEYVREPAGVVAGREELTASHYREKKNVQMYAQRKRYRFCTFSGETHDSSASISFCPKANTPMASVSRSGREMPRMG